MDSLKNLTPEQKEELVKKINTEVTSISEMEKASGEKITVPEAERLVAIASNSLIGCRKRAKELMLKMGKRELIRSVLAFLDLPQEGLPVYLKSEPEKLLFATGQRAISDRYIILYHHTMKLVAEERLKKQQEQQTENGDQNGE